ncbi:hypothetical protein S40293_07608 [Stachybotrys chartarum IBT 40293]|nr:hypothetical protein S40293_07608 [Stachybotrys chartarum IBT 40293]
MGRLCAMLSTAGDMVQQEAGEYHTAGQQLEQSAAGQALYGQDKARFEYQKRQRRTESMALERAAQEQRVRDSRPRPTDGPADAEALRRAETESQRLAALYHAQYVEMMRPLERRGRAERDREEAADYARVVEAEARKLEEQQAKDLGERTRATEEDEEERRRRETEAAEKEAMKVEAEESRPKRGGWRPGVQLSLRRGWRRRARVWRSGRRLRRVLLRVEVGGGS